MTPTKLLVTCAAVIVVGVAILVATYKPPEEDPSAWHHYRESSLIHGTRYSATLDEIGGPGFLRLECVGFLQAVLDTSRGEFRDSPTSLPLHYRVDAAPPVQVEATFDGRQFWFDISGTGDAPLVAPIQRGRRLVVATATRSGERIVMRFDISRSTEAVGRMRENCARRG